VLGIYYDPGKEPPPDGPPKLHLLIESNEEFRVRCSIGIVHIFLNPKITDRWRTLYAKSSDCLSKLPQLHSKQRCAILPHQQGVTALFKNRNDH